MEFTKVNYKTEGKTAIISMNSPKNLNAFDETLIDELVEALHLADEDPQVKAVLLNSTCKAFSAGGDIGAMYMGIKNNDLDFAGAIAKMASVTVAIKKLTKPVICAVRGAAAGAGFNVALACDYVIADESAMFMQAFVNIGLIPDAGGFYLLTRAVGVNKATELAMTGRPVPAQEAKDLGFVAQVVKPEEFDAAVEATMKRFTYGPSVSFAEMKRLIWESDFKNFEDYIQEEVRSQTICGETADFKEGICAFVEKRKPAFA